MTPRNRTWLPNRNATLVDFGGGDKNPLNGEYYVRGGVCWPVAVRVSDGQSSVGHLVLVGHHLESGRRVVLDECQFVCVDPIVENGGVAFEGCANWFNSAWTNYFTRYLYWHQDETTHRMYLMQVLRSRMIEPKPGFIEIPWQDDQVAVSVMWKLGNTGQLKIQPDSVLLEQLRRFQAVLGRPDMGEYPAVHALLCALYGMERWPWRENHERD